MTNFLFFKTRAGAGRLTHAHLASLGLGLGLLPAVASAQPSVTAFAPAANAVATPRTSAVQATFSQPLTAASAGALKVHSAQRGGLRSRGTTPAVVSGNTLSYTPGPAQPWLPGETVTAIVTRAAASAGGALARPRVVQFTVATSPGSPGSFAGGSDPAVGNRPNHPTLADVDGDGDLDLLTANADSRSVSVRLNGGDATGSNTGVFTAGSEAFLNNVPQDLAVGDLDNDGDLDFVVAESFLNGTLTIRLNGGDATGSNTGVFAGGTTISVGLSAGAVALGDVDGDGDLDILYTGGPGTGLGSVVVLLNGRDNSGLNPGLFALTAATSVRVGNSPANLTLGDVDGDGDLDLLTANYGLNAGNTVSVRLNGGDASGSNTGLFGIAQEIAVGNRPNAVALGDVDGDGDLDLVTSNAQDNTVSVRLNGGDASGSNTGLFAAGADLAVGTDPRGVTLGDLDGDGDLDLVTANSTGSVNVRLNGGDATGSNTGLFSGTASVVVGSNPARPALGDVDGDGDLDLVTGNFNLAGTVSVRLNGGVAVAPVITGLTPASGPVGTSVTLTGVRLTTATGLALNGAPVPLANVTANTATSLTFTVPAGASSGPVAVTNAGGSSAANGPEFTVTPSLRGLTLSAGTLSPAFAGVTSSYSLAVPGSTAATTVTPTNAQTPGGTITVNGTAVSSGNPSASVPLSVGSNVITIVVAAPGGGASTTYTVTVTRAACVATASARNVTLTLGGNGTATLAPALVSNNSTSTCGAPALVLSRTAFDCTDVGAPVPVVLTVTDGFGGTATASATVTVLAPPAATLTSLSPATAPVGTTVTVTGTNLAGATALTVNGAQALISNLTGNSFRFVVPASASATGNLVLALPCGQVLSQPFSVGPLAARPATAAALTLYPNPTRNAVTVQGTLPHATVEVFDLLGQRVLIASTAADGTARLALPVDLAAGVYVVRTGAQVRRLAVK